MNEMIKRRKDEGFTLIELMIVIAVIGILAVVLMPKVGAIKTQAKSAGIDTNIRMVQAYTQSRITSWANANAGAGTTQAIVAADLTSALSGGTDLMANPFSGNKAVLNITSDYSATQDAVNINGLNVNLPTNPSLGLAGTIVVVPDGTINAVGDGIYIYAYDSKGTLMADKTVRITP